MDIMEVAHQQTPPPLNVAVLLERPPGDDDIHVHDYATPKAVLPLACARQLVRLASMASLRVARAHEAQRSPGSGGGSPPASPGSTGGAATADDAEAAAPQPERGGGFRPGLAATRVRVSSRLLALSVTPHAGGGGEHGGDGPGAPHSFAPPLGAGHQPPVRSPLASRPLGDAAGCSDRASLLSPASDASSSSAERPRPPPGSPPSVWGRRGVERSGGAVSAGGYIPLLLSSPPRFASSRALGRGGGPDADAGAGAGAAATAASGTCSAPSSLRNVHSSAHGGRTEESDGCLDVCGDVEREEQDVQLDDDGDGAAAASGDAGGAPPAAPPPAGAPASAALGFADAVSDHDQRVAAAFMLSIDHEEEAPDGDHSSATTAAAEPGQGVAAAAAAAVAPPAAPAASSSDPAPPPQPPRGRRLSIRDAAAAVELAAVASAAAAAGSDAASGSCDAQPAPQAGAAAVSDDSSAGGRPVSATVQEHDHSIPGVRHYPHKSELSEATGGGASPLVVPPAAGVREATCGGAHARPTPVEHQHQQPDDGSADRELRAVFTVHYPSEADPLHRPAEVIPGLWLGGWSASTDGAFLAAARVQEIINCAGKGDVTPAIVALQHAAGVRDVHYLDIEDVESFDCRASIVIGAQLINSALAAGRRVLVHCMQGVSRSVTIAVAFLMRHRGATLLDALRQVKRVRKYAYPNLGFLLQLMSMEQSRGGACSIPEQALTYHRSFAAAVEALRRRDVARDAATRASSVAQLGRDSRGELPTAAAGGRHDSRKHAHAAAVSMAASVAAVRARANGDSPAAAVGGRDAPPHCSGSGSPLPPCDLAGGGTQLGVAVAAGGGPAAPLRRPVAAATAATELACGCSDGGAGSPLLLCETGSAASVSGGSTPPGALTPSVLATPLPFGVPELSAALAAGLLRDSEDHAGARAAAAKAARRGGGKGCSVM